MRSPLTRVHYVKDLGQRILGGSLHHTRPTLFWHPVESLLMTPVGKVTAVGGEFQRRKIYGLESMDDVKALCRLTNVKFVDCLNWPDDE